MTSPLRSLTVALALLLAAAAPVPPGVLAQEAGTPAGEAAVVETTGRHTLAIEGRTLAYTTRVGTITLPEEGPPATAKLVYVAYSLDGADPSARPISFVVNGGPGAASAYLHLGALGPARLAFGPDGRAPAPPARVEPNPSTWLAFTDLVFVDPVGTGFSRAVGDDDGDGGDRRGGGGGGGDGREFWSVDGDLRAIGGFVRQYLTRSERWPSPKVLIGESYGGFRMAAMATRLPDEFGVALNGIVLVSPALEFELQSGAAWDVLPWALRVPSMAAVARAHGLGGSGGGGGGGGEDRAALAEVEAFAVGPLLPGLARGDGEAMARLAALLGLEPREVERDRGRIGPRRFADSLLERRDRAVSLYDGRIDYPSARGRGEDPYLSQVTAALAGGFADYVRNELGVGASLPYLVLNREVFRRWDWGEGRRSAPGAADELAEALTERPSFRALVAHGAHDLVTPYFASAYLMDQLVREPSARARLALKVYPGGHMFYARDASLELFRADAAVFFDELMAGGPGG